MSLDKKYDGLVKSNIKYAAEILFGNPYFINTKNLKFVLLKYNETYGSYRTTIYINRLIDRVEEIEMKDKLENFKKIIEKLSNKEQIIKMDKQGYEKNDIARTLGLSYQDIVEILKGRINIEIDER